MGAINFVFAHGAGAPSSHPWMQRWAARLATIGPVSVFDYPYMREMRKRPDPLPKLIAAHREALTRARQLYAGPTVLIGKSMGGRVGCHLALEEDVAAVICLSYPLCGGGDRAKLRAEVLHKLTTPILFVQGDRDEFGRVEPLQDLVAQIPAPAELKVIKGAGHFFDDQLEELKTAITGWVLGQSTTEATTRISSLERSTD